MSDLDELRIYLKQEIEDSETKMDVSSTSVVRDFELWVLFGGWGALRKALKKLEELEDE